MIVNYKHKRYHKLVQASKIARLKSQQSAATILKRIAHSKLVAYPVYVAKLHYSTKVKEMTKYIRTKEITEQIS